MEVIQRLVDQGNSVVMIEHNLDVLLQADHLIDLGPEGGDKGGHLVAFGTPEVVAQCKESWTGKFLKKML
jgi:excinuclease ABC subunit A